MYHCVQTSSPETLGRESPSRLQARGAHGEPWPANDTANPTNPTKQLTKSLPRATVTTTAPATSREVCEISHTPKQHHTRQRHTSADTRMWTQAQITRWTVQRDHRETGDPCLSSILEWLLRTSGFLARRWAPQSERFLLLSSRTPPSSAWGFRSHLRCPQGMCVDSCRSATTWVRPNLNKIVFIPFLTLLGSPTMATAENSPYAPDSLFPSHDHGKHSVPE